MISQRIIDIAVVLVILIMLDVFLGVVFVAIAIYLIVRKLKDRRS